ncbi:winged helix-turn-helix transcriptional regulator [Clostridium sp.]|uniref:winged helix-turn-helix transcriptional regulator n=1 Tax=Clostridium sp. TaxID=1506 RepID=UPI002631CA1C|nr:helix-turn-helix domain-containing protein [uncultured Clostridium sp.]
MDQEEEVYSAPFKYTLSIFSGKWKMTIMFWLSGRKILRYGELKKCIKGITHKMLSSQLKELETNDIIVRKEYHQVPPKVEYFLSEKGLSLMPILEAMCSWGHLHYKDEISENRI